MAGADRLGHVTILLLRVRSAMDKIDIQLADEVEHWAQQKAAEQQTDLSSFVEALLKERIELEEKCQAAAKDSAP
jgi:hypothetical protein